MRHQLKIITGHSESRHDQAIYSLLWKKARIPRRLSMEGCIYAARNRTGKSVLKQPMKMNL